MLPFVASSARFVLLGIALTASPVALADTDVTLWEIGSFNNSQTEFFSTAADRDFVCDAPPSTFGTAGSFVVGTTDDSLFPGEMRSTNASAGDPRYRWACPSVTIEFTLDDDVLDAVLVYARMGGELSTVYLDGVWLGTTGGTVDPHPTVDNAFFVGDLAAGLHTIRIVEETRGAGQDGYHWNDALGLYAVDPDADDDGVDDGDDACPDTAAGDLVDGAGCSIGQECPCDAAWKNHGRYVACVAAVVSDFGDAGLLDDAGVDAVVSAAARSDCGR